MEKELIDILDFGKTVTPDTWSVQDAVAKLFEEGGELSEAAMTKSGRLKHKIFKPDNDFEETADVLLCALDILGKLNEHMTSAEILEKLRLMLIKKSQKWRNVQALLT
jgi:NTP pyrophosphatase (non-canonical NTP hydrolase)